MDGACGTYGRRVSSIQVFGGKPVRKCHMEDLILNGRLLLKRIIKRQDILSYQYRSTGSLTLSCYISRSCYSSVLLQPTQPCCSKPSLFIANSVFLQKNLNPIVLLLPYTQTPPFHALLLTNNFIFNTQLNSVVSPSMLN